MQAGNFVLQLAPKERPHAHMVALRTSFVQLSLQNLEKQAAELLSILLDLSFLLGPAERLDKLFS